MMSDARWNMLRNYFVITKVILIGHAISVQLTVPQATLSKEDVA